MRDYLKEFRDSAERVKLYNQAIGLLYDARVDTLLMYLVAEYNLKLDGNNAIDIGALKAAEEQGFRRCMESLFALVDLKNPVEEEAPPRNYGAEDTLQGLGYTPEKIQKAIGASDE